MSAEYWNHNVAHHPFLLRSLPSPCRSALDVGCGDGLLAVRLAAVAGRVVGVDRSAEMIALAEARDGADRIDFLAVDFLDAVRLGWLPRREFDFVCSVTAIHHMDFGEALTAMAKLVAPGGTLIVIGLGRDASPLDWLIGGLQLPAMQVLRLLHGGKSAPDKMPIRDPEMSWGEVRRRARQVLPGCRYRRRFQLRYSIVWERPAS